MKAVDPRNKKKEEEGEEKRRRRRKKNKMRNGHILQFIKNHDTCAVHLNK